MNKTYYLQPADVVSFFFDPLEADLTIFKHYGIYDGYGSVIELTLNGGIKKIAWSDFVAKANNRKIVIEKYEDYSSKTNYTTEQIVQRAESMIGNRKKYNAISWNCEQFVNLVRYENPTSKQVNRVFVFSIAAVLLMSFSGSTK